MRRSSSGIASIEGKIDATLKPAAEGCFFFVGPPGRFSINQSVMGSTPVDPAGGVAPVAMPGVALCTSFAQPGKGVAVPK